MLRASRKLRRAITAIVVLVTGSLMTLSIAHAVELKLLSPQVMKPVLEQLIPEFERSSGNQVMISYATTSALIKEIKTGIAADLVILPPEQIKQLEKENKIIKDSSSPVARLEFGVIVRSGATKPDVSTVRFLKQALLSANSIASGDPEKSMSGEYFAKLIERLQIAAAIKPKIKTFASGTAALRAVANGEADIAVGVVSAAFEPGTELAGILPAQAKKFNTYAIGIPSSTDQIEAAKSLASFISSPKSLALMKSKGFSKP